MTVQKTTVEDREITYDIRLLSRGNQVYDRKRAPVEFVQGWLREFMTSLAQNPAGALDLRITQSSVSADAEGRVTITE